MKYIAIYFILALIGIFLVDFPTVLLAVIVYFAGMILVFLVNMKDKKNINLVINVYQVFYISGFVYICLCYLYMEWKGYEYLLAWDIHAYFLPMVNRFLEFESVSLAMFENWNGFSFFSLNHAGYFSYLIPFAYLSSYLDANLYVSMQFPTLLIASFSGVVIFKLLIVNKIESNKAYKFAVIICLFSVIFFYSTQLLRDIHVMFLYLLGIYLTFRENFSVINLINLLAVILISCTLRIETGLFLFVLVPVYLYLSMQQSRGKNAAILASLIIALSGITISGIFFNKISSIFFANKEYYIDSDKGTGVIGTLQSIPVAGDVLSIAYNAAQPIPFWLKYNAPLEDYRPEVYNVMTFPLSFASLFNWITLFFIITFLFIEKIRRKVSKYISKPMLYHLIIGFFYMYMQSAVMEQRRLMAYYVIFYILFYIIYTNISKKERNLLMMIAVGGYTMLQFTVLIFSI